MFLIQEEELEVLFLKRKIIKIALGIVIVFIYKPIKLKNVEEEIIAYADVLAHFDNLSLLYYISPEKRKMNEVKSLFVKIKNELWIYQNMWRCIVSLVVNIYYTGKNGSARMFAEEMVSSGIVDRVRAEEGNEKYEYFFPMDDTETVMLIDKWKNQEALDLHHKSEMMKEIADLRNKYELKMRVERFTEYEEN